MARWWSGGVVGALIAVSVVVVLSPPVERAAGVAGAYVPLERPERLLDSRAGATTSDGQFAGIGVRAAGSTLALRVAGRVGLPVDVDAVVLNVTAVEPGDVGFLTVFACDAAQPNASNLNYYAGTNIANTVVARIGGTGEVCVYTFAATHLVVDVAGYLPAGTFVPLSAPQRLLDSRVNATTADGQFAGIGVRAAGSTLALRVAGRVGLAADVGAVVLNVTAVEPGDVGFLTVFPCDSAQPNASNLNYYPGRNVANTVIARTAGNGDVCIYTFAATHLVVDVAGYLPDETYVPLGAPQRLLDSRPNATTADGQFAGIGLQVAGSALQLRVAGRVGVPADAGAVVLNVTAVEPGDVGFLTVFPTGTAQPNASNLNYYPGRNVANTVVAKIGNNGDVCVYTFAATHLVVDVAGYLPGPSPTAGGPDCPPPPPVGLLALDVLAGITVQNEQAAGYDRDLFPHWLDLDGDGCTTREEVLIRDSTTPAQVDMVGCTVVAGDWLSPYDGGRWTLPSDVDIDHVVALKEAWDSGAWSWTTPVRTAFANDLDDRRSLRAVTDSVNQSKSDADPSNWMPPLAGDWCRYLGDWIAIKARWQLTMDQSEAGRIRNIITGQCPDLRIASWPTAPAGPPPPPTTPPPTTAPSNCDPAYPTVCIPPPPPDLDCGEIAYRSFTVLPPDPHNFDGSDNDGIGCES